MNSDISSKPFIIGISGGAASGKSEVCRCIFEELLKKASDKKVIVLPMSFFYHQVAAMDIKKASQGNFDLDHPQTCDFKTLSDTLQKVKRREPVVLKCYDTVTFSYTQHLDLPSDIDIVIVKGILIFHKKEIRDLFDVKIFVEADADTRLSRRVLRDVYERKMQLNVVLSNYFNFVKPSFEEFCLPASTNWNFYQSSSSSEQRKNLLASFTHKEVRRCHSSPCS